MTARSDEGMWLLNEPPRAHLKEKYGFDLTDAWLAKAQRASVRFNSGGAGGGVSGRGPVVPHPPPRAAARAERGPPEQGNYRPGVHPPPRAGGAEGPGPEMQGPQRHRGG